MKENSLVSDENMRNSRHCRESLLSYITLCWPNLSYFLPISMGTVFFLTLEALLSSGWSKELFTSLLPCKATGSGRPDDNFLSLIQGKEGEHCASETQPPWGLLLEWAGYPAHSVHSDNQRHSLTFGSLSPVALRFLFSNVQKNQLLWWNTSNNITCWWIAFLAAGYHFIVIP